MEAAERKAIEEVLDYSLNIANDRTAYENEAFAEIATRLGVLIGIEIVEIKDEDDLLRWKKIEPGIPVKES